MKTIYKVLLALGALLSVIAFGLFLLVRGALGVADHGLDVAANSVDKLTAAAAKQTTNTAQAAKAEMKDTPEPVDTVKGGQSAPPAPDGKPAEIVKPAILPGEGSKPGEVNTQTATAKVPAVKKTDNAVEDDLADVGQLFKMLLSEGDDSGDGGDAVPALPGAADKSSDSEGDSIAGLVPGGDSPTLRGVMAGKYKGKEGKIIDDALEDPKAWRLLFFLGGGM